MKVFSIFFLIPSATEDLRGTTTHQCQGPLLDIEVIGVFSYYNLVLYMLQILTPTCDASYEEESSDESLSRTKGLVFRLKSNSSSLL